MRQSTPITGCVRRSVGRSVGRLVGLSVTHPFDDPHVAPYWPTWPCFFGHMLAIDVVSIRSSVHASSFRLPVLSSVNEPRFGA